jgi:hypothetical protein
MLREFPTQYANDDASLAEIAQILAAGILRLQKRPILASGTSEEISEIALETAGQWLEQSRVSRLSVSRG